MMLITTKVKEKKEDHVRGIHPLGNMNVETKFPAHGSRDISAWAEIMDRLSNHLCHPKGHYDSKATFSLLQLQRNVAQT